MTRRPDNPLAVDPLTKLPTRAHFVGQLRELIEGARRKKHYLALCLLGLDRFREFNHAFGPQSGDALLKDFARRFAGATNGCCVKGRLSGDEFAAVYSGVNMIAVETICGEVLKALNAPFLAQGVPVDLSGSIGVALFPTHGDKPLVLFQRAAIALDQAKQFGRGYAVYEPEEDPYSQRKLLFLGGVRNAIELNQFVLYYQPKVDIKTKRARGFEALIRWDHPQIGLVPPNEFIPIAERTGLIHTLSHWVLKEALKQCRAWRRAGFDRPIAVNLSPRNLHDRRLPDFIAGLLRENHLSPDVLELEITETMEMADAVHVSDALGRLSEMGIRTYIDDFGTGYSSLGHLKKLPVAGIKIDKSFVSQMVWDESDAVIVRSIIDLGHNLGLEVVAEGVESPEIWDRLSLLGCDTAQGYYMSRPKPAADLKRWIMESPWGFRSRNGAVGKRK